MFPTPTEISMMSLEIVFLLTQNLQASNNNSKTCWQQQNYLQQQKPQQQCSNSTATVQWQHSNSTATSQQHHSVNTATSHQQHNNNATTAKQESDVLTQRQHSLVLGVFSCVLCWDCFFMFLFLLPNPNPNPEWSLTHFFIGSDIVENTTKLLCCTKFRRFRFSRTNCKVFSH